MKIRQTIRYYVNHGGRDVHKSFFFFLLRRVVVLSTPRVGRLRVRILALKNCFFFSLQTIYSSSENYTACFLTSTGLLSRKGGGGNRSGPEVNQSPPFSAMVKNA